MSDSEIKHWLSIWDAATRRYPSFEEAVEGLKFAVLKLYLLQEPPSVRESRRRRDEQRALRGMRQGDANQ